MESEWLEETMFSPGEEWTKGEDEELPRTTNILGEISSIDGTLAVDETSGTFWDVNPRGIHFSFLATYANLIFLIYDVDCTLAIL